MSDEARKPPPEMATAELSAWIRGFTRGATNDPPENMGDPLYDNRDGASGCYMEGFKLGGRIRQYPGQLDQSGTLHVESDAPGLEVKAQARLVGMDGPMAKLGVTPLDCKIGTGWFDVHVGDRWMAVYIEPGSKTTITADWQLTQVYR